jgi:hypothetical protein
MAKTMTATAILLTDLERVGMVIHVMGLIQTFAKKDHINVAVVIKPVLTKPAVQKKSVMAKTMTVMER